MERKIQDPTHNEWVGLGKVISIWILVQKIDTNQTDYYRYLSSNDLKNFIQRGYYHYIKKYEENLTLYYLFCERLSIQTQDLEKAFNNSPERLYSNFKTATNDEKRKYLEDYIESLIAIIIFFKPGLESQCKKLQINLRKDIFYVIKLYLVN